MALAILLYQLEHGTIPNHNGLDENWAEQIEKYLGEQPEHYFSCPANPSPKGETVYALVQYGDDLPENLDTILLIELATSVPFAEAVISVDEILEGKYTKTHHGGINTADRSGRVRLLPLHSLSHRGNEELLRLLGREIENDR